MGTMRDIFSSHYQTNFWRSNESVSGQGSTMAETEHLRDVLPVLFAQLGVASVLDIPCGDFHWFKEVWPTIATSISYIGADVVPELIEENQLLYPNVRFEVMDVTLTDLPKVDLVMCRDLFGHLNNFSVQLALRNLKRSGSKYLLATTFPQHETNGDIQTGQWRPINLSSMFGLPAPILLINEGCRSGGGQFADKSLGLWELQS